MVMVYSVTYCRYNTVPGNGRLITDLTQLSILPSPLCYKWLDCIISHNLSSEVVSGMYLVHALKKKLGPQCIAHTKPWPTWLAFFLNFFDLNLSPKGFRNETSFNWGMWHVHLYGKIRDRVLSVRYKPKVVLINKYANVSCNYVVYHSSRKLK